MESELADLLRLRLRERLEPEGWTAVEDRLMLAAFRRPLEHGIEATATVGPRAHSLREPAYLTVAQLHFGVAFEPLRRLAPLLGGEFERPVAARPADGQLLPEGSHELELRSVEEVRDLAERIGGLVLRRGARFASAFRTVDDLLAASGDVLHRVALLAAAGRWDEAAGELEAWAPGPDTDHLDRVLARRLRRYVESRGDASLIPAEIPPDRFDASRPGRPGLSELWAQSRARDAAVKAVAAAPRDSPREELRARLAAELSARSVTGDPIWIENTLDHLWDTRAERWEAAGSALLRLGRGVAKAISERQLPDLRPPTWLEPPDFAGYAMPAADERIAVVLDGDASPHLERVHRGMTTVFGLAKLTAWLRWEDDAARELAVHLGERRVGVVPETAAARYRPAMDAAAVREEVPYLDAVLVTRPDPEGYLLEIAAPR